MPDFDGRDAWADGFNSRISEAVAEGPNFAGYLRVIEIGCGYGCVFAYVVDLKIGQVFSFPYGGEEQYRLNLRFTDISRLMIATWQQNENDCLTQALVWSEQIFTVEAQEIYPMEEAPCE